MDKIMTRLLLGLILSYLIGSIPSGYLLGKIIKGVDLRQHGSGNLGATNAFRVLGKGIGAGVLIVDILKGTFAVILAKNYFYQENMGISLNLFLCLTAIAVVSGHNWTIFLRFKGGKGIATSLGVLIAFAILIERFIWVVLCVVFLWLIIFLSSGFVSLASVLCSIALPLASIFFHLPKEIIILLSVLGVFSVIRHKPNISRLLQKKESRFHPLRFIKKTP